MRRGWLTYARSVQVAMWLIVVCSFQVACVLISFCMQLNLEFCSFCNCCVVEWCVLILNDHRVYCCMLVLFSLNWFLCVLISELLCGWLCMLILNFHRVDCYMFDSSCLRVDCYVQLFFVAVWFIVPSTCCMLLWGRMLVWSFCKRCVGDCCHRVDRCVHLFWSCHRVNCCIHSFWVAAWLIVMWHLKTGERSMVVMAAVIFRTQPLLYMARQWHQLIPSTYPYRYLFSWHRSLAHRPIYEPPKIQKTVGDKYYPIYSAIY